MTQVFVEAQKHELATLNVEVHNKVVASLVETIVVDLTRLIQQNLLASSLDGSHDLLVVRGQVIHVKLLLLHKEEGGSDSDRCVSFFLQLEHRHTLIISRSEVVQSRMRGHDPVSVSVLSHSVDGKTSLHVPNS